MKEKDLDLIISIVIGDGYLYKPYNHNTYTLEIGHGKQQEDYLIWKMDLLNKQFGFNIVNREKTINNKLLKKQYTQVCFAKTSRIFEEAYNILYPDGKKTIKNAIKHFKSDRLLAIWFMDDGSVFKRKRKNKKGEIYFLRPSLKLCTHSFTYEDCLLILDWFKRRYMIEGYIVKERKKQTGKEYNTINFNCKNTQKIYKIINPYIQVNSMKIKFDYLISYYKENGFL